MISVPRSIRNYLSETVSCPLSCSSNEHYHIYEIYSSEFGFIWFKFIIWITPPLSKNKKEYLWRKLHESDIWFRIWNTCDRQISILFLIDDCCKASNIKLNWRLGHLVVERKIWQLNAKFIADELNLIAISNSFKNRNSFFGPCLK